MTLRKLIVVPIALVAAGIAGLYALRNPERSDMSAATRQGVPGKFVALGDGVTVRNWATVLKIQALVG